MQRKEAEKLLAALIFDDLDESSKTELLNYLQTDNELRERLADMRMAVKVASDTVQHGPNPVLGKRRLKHLAKLARHQRSWTTFFTAPRLAAAAAIFIISAIVLIGIQTRKAGVAWSVAHERVPTYKLSLSDTPEGAPSPSKQTTEITSTTGQFALASKARRPEVVDEGYAYDPAVRGPAAVDRTILGLPETVTDLAFQNGRRRSIIDNFEETTGEQTSTPGYAYLPTKPDSVEKWASGSSFEGKPHSGVTIGGGDGSYDIGGGYGGGMGMMGGPGGMGGYGGGGYGGGMGMGGYGGGGYGGYGGGMGGMGGGYSSRGGDGSYGDGSGYSNYGVRGREFYFHSGKDSSAEGLKAGNRGDTGSGFVSGDRLGFRADIYNGNIDFRGKETKLFTSPDVTGVVADGDSIAVGGGVIFQNGQAAVTSTDGPTVNIIDNFEGYIDKDGDRRPVVIDEIRPVTITGPELTPPPPPARPPQPISDVSGISEMPGLKLKTDSGDSILKAEDIKTHGWWAEMRADAYDNEAVFKKSVDELGTKSLYFHSEKAKPSFPGSSLVEQGSRRGDVSKEAEEESTGERDEKSVSSLEKVISEFPQPTDEIKTLPGTKQSADYESSIPAGGPAGKEENGRVKVPIMGDLPIINHLYSDADIKRPLTDEEKKEIIAHFEDRKSQPKGESADLGFEAIKLKYANPQEVENIVDCDFRDLSGAKFLPDFSIESLPQDKQIIIFGRKEQREAVKNMVREIDVPPGQSKVDQTSIRTGEDEPDLPPASRFKLVPVNPWVMAERDSLSTFALDVDTASYTLCRRYIRGGFLPPAGAVRMEEFINYFNYHYPQRTNPTFKVHAEAAPSPFARREQNLTLLKIGVKARTIGRDQRKAAHLIIVVDASASMDQPDRLPLVQRALSLLVNKLSAVDRVSLITCANEARLHLETTPARERDRIRQAINAIQPAGSTNLLAGLKLGYATARRSFAPKQINHVVLCSDGVANVGQTEAEAVLNEVAADRKQGITITCVGVGYGSYNDVFLEALANQGDGSYMFLDSVRQVHRVFVRQLAATLQTVAKDARIQVDFNPHRVRRYRLIGYENRDIEDKRFRDDTIDAGEVGSGQCSTALYELELIGRPSADRQEDLGTVFVRYRNVATGQIEEISNRLGSAIVRRHTVESAPRFFLAAGAARFAEILRQSEHARGGNLMDVLRVVEQVSLALPLDRDVRELAELIRKSENLPRSP